MNLYVWAFGALGKKKFKSLKVCYSSFSYKTSFICLAVMSPRESPWARLTLVQNTYPIQFLTIFHIRIDLQLCSHRQCTYLYCLNHNRYTVESPNTSKQSLISTVWTLLHNQKNQKKLLQI